MKSHIMTKTELEKEIKGKLFEISMFHYTYNVTDLLFKTWSEQVDDPEDIEALKEYSRLLTLELKSLGILT